MSKVGTFIYSHLHCQIEEKPICLIISYILIFVLFPLKNNLHWGIVLLFCGNIFERPVNVRVVIQLLLVQESLNRFRFGCHKHLQIGPR